MTQIQRHTHAAQRDLKPRRIRARRSEVGDLHMDCTEALLYEAGSIPRSIACLNWKDQTSPYKLQSATPYKRYKSSQTQ